MSLSFTTLTYPNGYIQKVWLYDGNVNYLGREAYSSVHSGFVRVALPVISLHSFTTDNSVATATHTTQGTQLGVQIQASLRCLHGTVQGQTPLLARIASAGSCGIVSSVFTQWV